jgi:uroporphyrin-3 C-methyltransferase
MAAICGLTETAMSESSKAMSESGNNTQDPASGYKSTTSRQALGTTTLLLAALALLAAGWANWQLESLRQLPERISVDGSRLATLTRQIDTLTANSNRQQQQLADLASSLEDGLGVLPELAARIQQNEQQLASLPAMDASSRSAWLKTEALYYLQIANAQATLAGDPQMAANALQFADDKLRDAGDPSLATVRAQLTKDLVALRAMPQSDRVGMSFRLQALASQAATWPFQSAAPERFAPDIRSAAAAPDGAMWERFVATLKAVFASIVSIKQTAAVPVAQLGSAERALIVAALEAELQLARLALAANDAESFSQSLQQITAQVQKYFDPQSAAVSAALVTLKELRAAELPGPMPDISGTLTLMLAAGADVAPASAGDGT